MPPPPSFGAVANYWTEGLTGDSEAQAYLIDSQEDFVAFRDRVNNGSEPHSKYYKQIIDISITGGWTPIANNSYRPFRGHYNGNGKKITNSATKNQKQDLFNYIDVQDGIYAIKNLSIDYTVPLYDESGTNFSSTLVTFLINGTIDNIRVNSSVSRWVYDGDPAAGGIVAVVYAGGVVKNCVFNGSVWADRLNGGNARAGGIAGRLEGGTIENCLVSSDIWTNNNTGTRNAGGVVGEVIGKTSKVVNCAFKGNVYSNQYAGGIAGYVDGGTVLSSYVLDGSNVESNIVAGGIAGYLGSEGVISADKIVMTSNVRAKGDAVGGIVGLLDSGKVMYNWAYTVIATEAPYNAQFAGPIVGKIQPGSKVPPIKYTVKYNRYKAGMIPTETYEGTVDTYEGSDTDKEHDPENLTATEMNPIDPNAGKSTGTNETGTGTEEGGAGTDTGTTTTTPVQTYEPLTLNNEQQTTLNTVIRSNDSTIEEDTPVLDLVAGIATSVDHAGSDVTEAELGGQTLVLALPKITVNRNAIYTWSVTLKGLATGANIFVKINDTKAIFIDANGNEIANATMPADGKVRIAAYLKQGVTYSPIITTATAAPSTESPSTTSTDATASNDKDGGGDSGGGCETGFGIIGLVIMVGALGLKKSRN